jgi:hypothetical protein
MFAFHNLDLTIYPDIDLAQSAKDVAETVPLLRFEDGVRYGGDSALRLRICSNSRKGHRNACRARVESVGGGKWR